ncbi:MAG: DNA/RNA nuclease SfsA [Proteobacteria bacterium]|nr:DNA/RNA nuclease SfsA [Pseudomonadota bacterium]
MTRAHHWHTGTLIKRYKRFLADVRLDTGETVTAHVPNTGAMLSTRTPGSPVALSWHDNPARKYPWTLELVQADGCWVGVNTAKTNGLVAQAIAQGRIAPLRGYPDLRREVPLGAHSRIDIALEKPGEFCFIEVKNATWRVGSQARFPDAVTERGTRHLHALIQARREGHRAVIFFLVNRGDCTSLAPAADVDPVYAQTLADAVDAGVEALAYRVRNDLNGARVDRRIPVRLPR